MDTNRILSALQSSELSDVGPIDKVVAEVRNPLNSKDVSFGEMPFPGLFVDQLPRECFLSDNNSVVLSSFWGSSEVPLLVALNDLTVTKLSEVGPLSAGKNDLSLHRDDAESSCSILDVCGDILLVVVSSPVQPQQLCVFDCKRRQVIGRNNFISRFSIRKIKQTPVSEIPSAVTLSASTHNEVDLSDLHAVVFNHEVEGVPFDSILLFPKSPGMSGTPLPVVVVPHGGPHSITPTSFIASSAFLAVHLQAAVLSVNYRYRSIE